MGHPVIHDDRPFMAEALRVAATIPRRPWPNPPVGAVVVRDGRVVGRGAHHGAGTDHAEVVALRQAGELARGGTLYCTLEPCNHAGRTPPCAPVVAASGISRLVAAIRDPNPGVRGGGLALVRAAGVNVKLGVMAEEALELAWPFVCTRAFARPFVLLKTASSLDACFAPPSGKRTEGEPAYLTSPASRREAQLLRRWCDVVVVGERTMAVDRPRLDGRLLGDADACPGLDPLPAYVDTDLSLQGGWARPFWVFAGAARAPEGEKRRIEQGCGTVVKCTERDGHVAPEALVAEFGRRGGHCLMVEGGPRLAAAFLGAGVVDRWVSFIAPIVLGAGPRWPERESRGAFNLTRASAVGPDARLVLDREPFDRTLASLANPGEGY
jgi:diaminohydroxyphosphoribosylaminopyrimidine deaminase / 5-amino-6-(5-phosphoribosylamino)uracil reductase